MDQKNKDLDKFLNFLSGKSKKAAPSEGDSGDNVVKMSKKVLIIQRSISL